MTLEAAASENSSKFDNCNINCDSTALTITETPNPLTYSASGQAITYTYTVLTGDGEIKETYHCYRRQVWHNDYFKTVITLH